jgi:hypothetical protein
MAEKGKHQQNYATQVNMTLGFLNMSLHFSVEEQQF